MRKPTFAVTLMIIAFTTFVACSDSSTNADVEEENGQGSFTLSGDVQSSFEGSAIFATTNAGGIFTGTLVISDDAEDTFSLVFTTSSTNPVSIPTGVYAIDIPESIGDGTIFVATFTDFTNDVPKVFQTKQDAGGSLTVSRSTDQLLEGTFQFEALGNSGEEVTVEGSFSAVK
ncbi:MAG: hypothetical protein ACQETM_10340 [Bacteroidota bacterium]